MDSLEDNILIDEIQHIRTKNNELWMNLLRIAFRESPEETRQIFKQIAENDHKINQISKELVSDQS